MVKSFKYYRGNKGPVVVVVIVVVVVVVKRPSRSSVVKWHGRRFNGLVKNCGIFPFSA